MTVGRVALAAIAGFILVAVAGVLLRPLLPIDETRYLSVAWEMHLGGDYLVPHKNGAIYTHKPPMLFWLINLVWTVTGVSEIAARLVAPAFVLLGILLTGTLARRFWPEVEGVGARAVVVLAGTTVFAVLGGLTMFDSMLAFATLGGLLALLPALRRGQIRYWLLYGAALAFGGLAKGPVILIHLLPPLLLYPVWLPARDRRRPLAVLAGAAIAIVFALFLVGLWLVPAIRAGGPDYRDAILWSQSAGRIANSFAHSRPWWWFAALLPLLLFPWIWSPVVWRAVPRLPLAEPGTRLCLVWALAPFVLFSLISGKQVHYLMPELPAVALLVARALPPDAAKARWEPAILPAVLLALLAVGMGLGLLHGGDIASLLQPAPMLIGWAVLVALLAWGSVRVGGYAGLALLGLGLVLSLNLLFGTTRAREAYDGSAIASRLRCFEDRGIAVVSTGYNAEFNFTGRLTRPLDELPDPSALEAWAPAHPGGLVIAEVGRKAPDWPARETIRFGGEDWGLWLVSDRPGAEPRSDAPVALDCE
jgi:4-amino-4-deoxy-L-arabinose transferase-like glycosyltransferase